MELQPVRALVVLLPLLTCGACADGSSGDAAADRNAAGDTAVIVNRSSPVVQRIDSVRVLWQSPDLERPAAMTIIGTRLVVADPTRFHVIDVGTGATRTIGRAGEGPGEFRNLSAVSALADSILTYDSRLIRLSVFTPELQLARTATLTPRPPFVNPLHAVLQPYEGGLLLIRQENLNTRGPTLAALLWHDIEMDTSTVLQTWPDLHYIMLPGDYVGPRQILGPEAKLAVSHDGTQIAHGEGVEYCITIRQLVVSPAGTGVERVCREWQRARTGTAIRRPDFSVIADPGRRQVLEGTVAAQEVPDRMPSFDVLRFDAGGRLWVRTIGPELADIHPYILRRMPELGPAHRRWDVFGRDRTLLRTLELPSNFDPRVLLEDRAFGFYELGTGEVVIGLVELSG